MEEKEEEKTIMDHVGCVQIQKKKTFKRKKIIIIYENDNKCH